MSKKILVHLNLSKNELQNAVLQPLASDPSSPVEGQIYYNTSTKKARQYDGTSWIEYGTGTGAGDVSQASNSGGGGIMKVSAGDNKVIADYSGGAGLIKSDANGVVSPAEIGTDYVTESSTNTLTNKTFDANGDGNSITNIETADFASGVFETSISGSSTNTQIPSALAVYNAIQAGFDANDAMQFKGGIDCSTNPNYPSASAGWTYKVTVAGKIGGASGIDVQAGDTLYCTVDGSASGNHATVGENWTIVQANVDRATETTLGLAEHATVEETEDRASSTVVVTPAGLANYGLKKTFTIGNGSATSIACTHSLGNKDVIVQVREVSTDEIVECDIVNESTTVTTLSFAVAPATNSLRVVIIG